MTRWYWLLMSFVDQAFAAPKPAFLGTSRPGARTVPTAPGASVVSPALTTYCGLRMVRSVGLVKVTEVCRPVTIAVLNKLYASTHSWTFLAPFPMGKLRATARFVV